MNPALFATILLRTLSVYFVLQGFMIVAQTVGASLTLGNLPGGMKYSWPDAAWVVIPFLSGVLLWALAPRISLAIVGEDTLRSGQAPLTTESALGAVISAAGLLVVITHLPTLIVMLSRYAIDTDEMISSLPLHYLIRQALEVGFGLMLLIGMRAWVRLIKFLREIGLQK